MHAAEFGKIFSLEETNGLPKASVFPNERNYVNSRGFFRNLPVIQNSQGILELLNDRYKIFIVSAAMEFPNRLLEKQAWLNEHFPFISWRQMVFYGDKEIKKAAIMIDEDFKNLDHFEGETILFSQPHNILAGPGKRKRVNSWKEIESILLP